MQTFATSILTRFYRNNRQTLGLEALTALVIACLCRRDFSSDGEATGDEYATWRVDNTLQVLHALYKQHHTPASVHLSDRDVLLDLKRALTYSVAINNDNIRQAKAEAVQVRQACDNRVQSVAKVWLVGKALAKAVAFWYAKDIRAAGDKVRELETECLGLADSGALKSLHEVVADLLRLDTAEWYLKRLDEMLADH